jgi:hypothetical protein
MSRGKTQKRCASRAQLNRNSKNRSKHSSKRISARSSKKRRARARVGGDDIEMGLKEQSGQEIRNMEEGRSYSPPVPKVVPSSPVARHLNVRPNTFNKMEEGRSQGPQYPVVPNPTLGKKIGGPGADLKVGGRKKKVRFSKRKTHKKKNLFDQLFGL